MTCAPQNAGSDERFNSFMTQCSVSAPLALSRSIEERAALCTLRSCCLTAVAADLHEAHLGGLNCTFSHDARSWQCARSPPEGFHWCSSP